MAAREPWFAPYERPGRSGMVAQMSSTCGLTPIDWARIAIQEQARRDAGWETDDDFA